MLPDKLPSFVHPVWKEVGKSTHRIAREAQNAWGVPVAHTGILDPAAEGVIVLLGGEARFEKARFTNTPKVYRVTCLCGVETDTHDLLGLPLASRSVSFIPDASLFIKQTVGEYFQIPPLYSARAYKGKPLHNWMRQGVVPETASLGRIVTLVNGAMVETGTVTKEDVIARGKWVADVTEGDFRQDAIRAAWEAAYPTLPETFPTITLLLTTGPGFYVRSFVRDLGVSLSLPVTVYSLVREENAGFSRESCLLAGPLADAVPVATLPEPLRAVD